MNATKAARQLLTAMVGMVVAQGAASEIYVGTGNTVRHNVATDAVQAENVVVAPRGTLLKTGEGTWTLPTSKVVQGWDANIAVDQGALKIRLDAAPATTGFETPPTVMQTAAVWFDTKKVDSFVRDGSDNITDWLDRRETGNANDGYAYTRAHTDNTVTNLYPELKAKGGTTGLYFQGYRSGCWMNLLTPANAQGRIDSYNVFAVQGQFDKYAALFGCRKNLTSTKLAFVPGNASGVFAPFWTFYNYDIPNMYAARNYIDGSEVDAFTTQTEYFPTNRFALLEVEFLDKPGAFQCFFNDRDFWASWNAPGMNYNTGAGNRIGGEYICEVVAFTNALTAAERLEVEGYLMAKWFGVKRPSSLSVSTAPGTQVEIDASVSGGETVPVSIDGGGDLVVNGVGERTFDTISLLGGFTGCLRLGSGSLMTKNSQTVSAAAGVELSMAESYDGQTLSRTAAAAADTFVKSGTGTMRVNALPAAVKKLRVTGGELALELPRDPSFTALADPSAVITGSVPNASFEIGVGATTTTINLGSTGYQGWTAVAGAGANSSDLAWINHSAYKGGKNTSSIYWKLPTEVPDGESVLAINKGASVWTTITLPQEGVYELTFKGSVRTDKSGLILELAVGSDAESLETFGYFRAAEPKTKYYSYRYLLPRLAAGSYQLWFKQVDDFQDRCSLIDDVKLTRIPDRRLCEEVPNGSFEHFKGTYADLPYPAMFTNANFNALTDWTIVQAPIPAGITSSSTNYAGSGPVLRSMCQIARLGGNTGWTGQFYNQREGDDGCVQLYLVHGATASVTFTPPAGRYFVEADIGLWRTTSDSAFHMVASAGVTPSGGEAVSLGDVQVNRDYIMKRRMFPTAFMADGTTPVTLTLSANKQSQDTLKTGHLLFDNVRLVLASSTYQDNLIANGSFSSDTVWSYYNRSGLSDNSYKPKRLAKSDNNSIYYGANWLDGYCLLVVDNGLVTQSISVPEAGRYRLQVAARKRVMSGNPTSKATNPILFWTARGGVTNEIARFAPSVTNFTLYSWAFNVPAAGNDWTFGIEGLGTTGNDQNTLLDNMSIVREPVSADAPEMDEDLEIRVAAGAKLRLDFPGTNIIRKLVLGGRSYIETVSAKDAPEYLSGDGAFYVPPKGMAMIIR